MTCEVLERKERGHCGEFINMHINCGTKFSVIFSRPFLFIFRVALQLDSVELMASFKIHNNCYKRSSDCSCQFHTQPHFYLSEEDESGNDKSMRTIHFILQLYPSKCNNSSLSANEMKE